ncbi:hypothetical protein STEG23_016960 [Scotinomys teguina]
MPHTPSGISFAPASIIQYKLAILDKNAAYRKICMENQQHLRPCILLDKPEMSEDVMSQLAPPAAGLDFMPDVILLEP